MKKAKTAIKIIWVIFLLFSIGVTIVDHEVTYNTWVPIAAAAVVSVAIYYGTKISLKK